MGLVYLPTFTIKNSTIHVGKYTIVPWIRHGQGIFRELIIFFTFPTPKAVLTLQYIGFMGSHVMGSLRGMGVPLLVYSYKIQMFFFANKNHGFLEDGLLS